MASKAGQRPLRIWGFWPCERKKSVIGLLWWMDIWEPFLPCSMLTAKQMFPGPKLFTLLLLGKATPTPDPAAPSSLITVLQWFFKNFWVAMICSAPGLIREEEAAHLSVSRYLARDMDPHLLYVSSSKRRERSSVCQDIKCIMDANNS